MIMQIRSNTVKCACNILHIACAVCTLYYNQEHMFLVLFRNNIIQGDVAMISSLVGRSSSIFRVLTVEC